jgi:hypothetical protein
LPLLPISGYPELEAHMSLEHFNRGIHDEKCREEAFHLTAAPIAYLRRTGVREAMGLDVISNAPDMARWLVDPWPAIPTLLRLHRLVLLNHFLLPTTRHSPLAGGFVFDDKTGVIAPYMGPSETDLTYMADMEATIIYTVIDSIRPTVTGQRTVQITGLDGKTTSSVKESAV